MVEPLVKRAADIEKKAVKSYSDAIGLLRGQGLKYTDVEAVVSKIAIETIIHKHLMKAIQDAQKEIGKFRKGYEMVKEPEKIEPSKEQASVIRRLAEMHLELEKGMIEHYKKMAEKVENPLLKIIAESLAKNEEEHHRVLADLISRYR